MAAAPVEAAPKCTIKGTAGVDELSGTRGADVICGGAGKDVIWAGGGNDVARGGPGADSLGGGAGQDLLIGGPGVDLCRDSAQTDRRSCELPGKFRPPTKPMPSRMPERTCPGVPGCSDGVTAVPDTAPPTLFSAEFQQRYIDTSGGDGTLVLNLIAWDESGIKTIAVDLEGPGGTWRHLVFDDGPTETGFFDLEIAVPASTPSGTYRLSGLTLTDAVGHTESFDYEVLPTYGYHQSWEVFEGPDIEGPELTGFSISPASVDTSTAATTVPLEVSATDELSGVAHAYAYVVPPWWSRPLLAFPGGYGIGGSRVAGTIRDGTWRTNFPLPRFAQPGSYEISAVSLEDQAGNETVYDPAELEALGLPTEFEQVATGDSTPPQIHDFWFTPQTVHSPQGEDPGTVTFSAELSDDLSGLGESPESVFSDIWLSLDVPGNPPSFSSGGTVPEQTSGTKTHGVWSWELSLLPDAPLGDYTVDLITVVDRAGNALQLKGDELTARGWDLTFANAP